MNVMLTGRSILICLLLTVWLGGCKAKPAPSAGFADPAEMNHDPTIPFNKFWRKSDVNWKQYDKLYVSDVNTSYMLKMTDWQKGERKDQIEHDVHELGTYARDSLQKAFRDDPNHRFNVIDSPTKDRHALVLEMALIEIVPSKVTLNVLGYAPFFVGLGVSAVRTVAHDESSAAFEARVRDAATGKVIMLAADREEQQMAPVNLRGL